MSQDKLDTVVQCSECDWVGTYRMCRFGPDNYCCPECGKDALHEIAPRIVNHSTPQTAHNRYRRVRKEGGSRVLTVSDIIPLNWNMVRLVVEDTQHKPDRQWVRVRIERVS